MRLKTYNLWIDKQSLSVFNHFFEIRIISNILVQSLFAWFILNFEEIIFKAFLNLKVFNDLWSEKSAHQISLWKYSTQNHHNHITITITNTSQTDFISISGYTGPHTCTVVYLCSISMVLALNSWHWIFLIVFTSSCISFITFCL